MTISRSLRITAALPCAITALLDLTTQCRQALLQVQRGQHLRQFQPQLHQGDGHSWLQASDDNIRYASLYGRVSALYAVGLFSSICRRSHHRIGMLATDAYKACDREIMSA